MIRKTFVTHVTFSNLFPSTEITLCALCTASILNIHEGRMEQTLNKSTSHYHNFSFPRSSGWNSFQASFVCQYKHFLWLRHVTMKQLCLTKPCMSILKSSQYQKMALQKATQFSEDEEFSSP